MDEALTPNEKPDVEVQSTSEQTPTEKPKRHWTPNPKGNPNINRYRTEGSRMRKSVTPLTWMQEAYVQAYIADKEHNQTAAALKAGYSPKIAHVVGCMLMKKPEIQDRIKHYFHVAQTNALISAEQVLKNIQEIGDVCKKKMPVFDPLGRELVGKKRLIDAQSALRSQELLGKHLELFTDKVKQTGNVELNIVINKPNVGKLEKHT